MEKNIRKNKPATEWTDHTGCNYQVYLFSGVGMLHDHAACPSDKRSRVYRWTNIPDISAILFKGALPPEAVWHKYGIQQNFTGFYRRPDFGLKTN